MVAIDIYTAVWFLVAGVVCLFVWNLYLSYKIGKESEYFSGKLETVQKKFEAVADSLDYYKRIEETQQKIDGSFKKRFEDINKSINEIFDLLHEISGGVEG